MSKVEIYTDGSCLQNPGGKGGWSAILKHGAYEKEICGSEKSTTNNRMEMLGVIGGLKALKRPCEVVIYSDSAYVVNAFNNGWVNKWHKNGWKTTTGDVKNKELWELLIGLVKIHKVTFCKVNGHADNELNNRADEIARAAAIRQLNGVYVG
jgi:ribonuclease HI